MSLKVGLDVLEIIESSEWSRTSQDICGRARL